MREGGGGRGEMEGGGGWEGGRMILMDHLH